MNKIVGIDLANHVIDLAKKHGADEASVVLSKNKQSSIEIRNGNIDLLEASDQASITLSLYIDKRYSVNQTSILDKGSIEEFIQNSIEITKQINRDQYRSLPDPDLYWKEKEVDLQINDRKYLELLPETKKTIVFDLEKQTKAKSSKIVSVTSTYSDSYSEFIKINSNGFSGEKKSTVFSLGSEVVVKDIKGALPSDWYYSTTRFFKDISALDTIAEKSVKMAERKIGQRKISSGIYDMIVSNRSSSKLIGMILSSLTGSKLWNKSSFLDGKLNQKIFSDKLSIIDEPLLKKGLGSRSFDSDGFKTEKHNIIEKGILKRYLINNYFSKKLKLSPTSGSTGNVLFKIGNKSFSELIMDISNGIYVTGFLGGNFNSTTGDYSFGINGILIENGILTTPVNEMNITGNAISLFNDLNDLGNDPYLYSSYRTPTLSFNNVSFSGL